MRSSSALGVPDEIVQAFREFSLFDTGVALLQGLWDGMASLVPQMVSAISAKLSAIVPSWMKDAWNWVSGGGDGADVAAAAESAAAVDEFAGGRDSGGPVRAGIPYLVGERQPEIFVPGVSGSILPTRVLKAAMAASALATPVAAMPSKAEIAATLDRRPVISAPAAAPQITRHGDTITINIHPHAGMSAEDVGREVERRLARRENARRADLHDGVDY
ncbi:hypothetical protein RYZ20_10940 [Thioclava sp. A2]|uniref:hypothetical protein n=1 Tax=Thioclava sp. FCG-A2 TaxID=3080562 RepID=UPI0029538517|nr:hypothetical protein [Thioclava sp. A2]MDV7271416.1 hypothetical protein [Thioclava sp. A2]